MLFAAVARAEIGLPPGRTRRQCAMTARHQKKPPDASREPEEPNASSRHSPARKEVSSMPTAPRPLSLSDQQLTAVLSRGRALGAARQKRLPCRQRECAARRGAAARRRGLSSATIKGRRQHNPPIPSQTRYAKPSEARRPSRRPTGARQSDRKTYILRLPANLRRRIVHCRQPTETFD